MDIPTFDSQWVVWLHKSTDSNWGINSYLKLLSISNMQNFWEFLNNIYMIDPKIYHIFIMRDTIEPRWEDPRNENGSTCSIKDNISNYTSIIESITIHVVGETLLTDNSTVNGFSLNSKDNWFIVKILTSGKKNIINEIPLKIKNLSKTMTMQHKVNKIDKINKK